MPIPIFLIGLGTGIAVWSVGKSIMEDVTPKEVQVTNTEKIFNEGGHIANGATELIETKRKCSEKAITTLGKKKIGILNNGIISFVNSFEKLQNVELTELIETIELHNFKMDNQSMEELKHLGVMASSVLGETTSENEISVITAFGAYGGAMLPEKVSAETAIALLSCAAATNATLTFLTGGAQAVGKNGMAGGSVVLGGLVSVHALTIMKIGSGEKDENGNEKFFLNLEIARVYEKEMETAALLCEEIRRRAMKFYSLLLRLDAIFEVLVDSMEMIIDNFGTDYSLFNERQKRIVAATVSVAGAIKTLLDTPILTKDGKLTEESGMVGEEVQKYLRNIKISDETAEYVEVEIKSAANL